MTGAEDISVSKVTVIISDGEDQVVMTLKAPTPYPNLNYAAQATLRAAQGHGIQWVRETMKVEPEVIDVSALRQAGPAKVG